MSRIFSALCAVLTVGCASESTVATVGEAGLLVWATTVFHGSDAPDSWADADFLMGAAYRVTAELTADGSSAILEPQTIGQRLRLADGAQGGTVEPLGQYSASIIEEVRMTPETTGTLYLEAIYQDDVVDVVALTVLSGRIQVDDGVVYGVDDGRW